MASPLVQLTGSMKPSPALQAAQCDPTRLRLKTLFQARICPPAGSSATAPEAAPLLYSRAYRQASQHYQTREAPARLAVPATTSDTVICPIPATVHRDAK